MVATDSKRLLGSPCGSVDAIVGTTFLCSSQFDARLSVDEGLSDGPTNTGPSTTM